MKLLNAFGYFLLLLNTGNHFVRQCDWMCNFVMVLNSYKIDLTRSICGAFEILVRSITNFLGESCLLFSIYTDTPQMEGTLKTEALFSDLVI